MCTVMWWGCQVGWGRGLIVHEVGLRVRVRSTTAQVGQAPVNVVQSVLAPALPLWNPPQVNDLKHQHQVL